MRLNNVMTLNPYSWLSGFFALKSFPQPPKSSAFVFKILFLEGSTRPTCFCDIAVCEQQQGEGVDCRRVSDENSPVWLHSVEEGQPATRELLFPSATKKSSQHFYICNTRAKTWCSWIWEFVQTCSLRSGEDEPAHFVCGRQYCWGESGLLCPQHLSSPEKKVGVVICGGHS